MNLTELAESIAENAHRGQFRKDGKTPFIKHPQAVKDNIIQYFKINPLELVYLTEEEVLDDTRVTKEILLSLAWLHDVVEDTKLSIKDIENIFKNNRVTISSVVREILLSELDILTKKKDETYLNYILSVNKSPLATVVKLADLKHNISDLKPGSLRDKYMLSQHVLLS